ncbi:hypothetical protein FPRO05_02955 [Fusarium proliferatum]|uniref:Uncharacterized protein n=1 Tax=Gibberella intermedia TaxID=948311 RepID=A0A365N029_GIBIN|nr:hypothetical protein FPRO05_02955 [Fusarium proliferatum]
MALRKVPLHRKHQVNNSGRPIYAPFAPKRNQPTICTFPHAEWTPLARPRFHSVSTRPEAPCLLTDVVWPPNPYPKGLPITAKDSRTDCVAQFDHGSNKSILQHPRNNRAIWDHLATYLSSYDDGSADCRVESHPDARVLRVRAEKLEEWWRNDTKSAARHDIDGRKLAEKEGGPSAINNLFQQTCQEMEAAEAKTTEDGGSEMEQQ